MVFESGAIRLANIFALNKPTAAAHVLVFCYDGSGRMESMKSSTNATDGGPCSRLCTLESAYSQVLLERSESL